MRRGCSVLFFVVALIVALAGCRKDVATELERVRGPALTATQVAQCEDDGGRITYTSLGANICQRPAPDAGQSCTSSTQCAGLCLAEQGQCSPYDVNLGCYDVLEDGQKVGICID